MRNIVTRLLAKGVLRLAERHMSRHAPDRVIGGVENPYMLRWFVLPRNRWFNIYLHNIVRSDDDRAEHDHPWISLSLMLRGVMGEYCNGRFRSISAGSLIYRGAAFKHRLVIPKSGSVVTVFVTGPKVREWGFWCPRGFVHWRDFTAGPNGETVGKGCGE